MAEQLPRVLVVSGVSSGVGKTSVAIGIMASLTHRGLRVQPFKVGPDFLDPMHHTVACGGVASVNLDGAMMGREGVLESFARHCRASKADFAIVEGCMGLFDSRDGHSDCGSTAEIAKWLDAPVVLVVDAWCLGRTAAAIVHGYASFDPNVRLAGVIFNKVGGKAHSQWLRDAIASTALTERVSVLGCLPKSAAVVMPERHLGLHLPTPDSSTSVLHELRRLIHSHVNLDLFDLTAGPVFPPSGATALSADPSSSSDSSHALLPPVRFGIAKDDAFCFYYHDNLHLLEAAGATLVYFSPLRDKTLPPGLHGIYFGGGYPELHASALMANTTLQSSVRDFARRGGLIYAECGGLMYLSQALHDGHGGLFSMVGLLPFDVTMTPRMVMGYVNATPSPALVSLLRLPPNLVLRCQQYHFSEATDSSGKPIEQLSREGVGIGWAGVAHHAYNVAMVHTSTTSCPPSLEGVVQDSTIASYCHVHFGATPEMAPALVQAARRKMRFVSLEATATETLGAIWSTTTSDDDAFPANPAVLHGISEFCTAPSWLVKSLPKLTLSLITATTSQDIERQVQEFHAAGVRDLHTIHTPTLRAAKPDVVFTQEACDRCAVTDSALLRALDAIGLAATTSTVLCRPRTVDEMLQQVLRLGAVVGEPKRGEALHASLTARLERVRKAVGVTNPVKPRVVGLESAFPLVVSGQWLPDMRIRAGGVEALWDSFPGCPPRRLLWDDIVTASPDVLVVACCGKSAYGSAKEVEDHLANLPGFWDLPAMQASPPRLFLLSHELSSRPGPQSVDGIEILAALLHPESNIPIAYPGPPESVLQFTGTRECMPAMTDHFVPVNLRPSLHCPSEQATEPVSFRPADAATPTTCSSEREPSIASTGPSNGSVPTALPVSAHVLLSWHDKLLLLQGDTSRRQLDANVLWEGSSSVVDGKYSWRPVPCTTVFGESVPTRRSNHAAVVWGDVVVVFGGWDAAGLRPLADLELLDLTTRCWTHGSSMGSPPSPRGNPSMVLESNSHVLVFGGWNGRKRFNDVTQLDLTTWTWTTLSMNVDDSPLHPSPRTDHTAVWWPCDNSPQPPKDESCRRRRGVMVVFGGSDKSLGPRNDVWAFYPDRTGIAWESWTCSGDVPSRRTSHAAILVHGHVMVVTGGQSHLTRGGSVMDSVYALDLTTKVWRRLGQSLLHPVCRHSMAILSNGKDTSSVDMAVVGGYDGKKSTSLVQILSLSQDDAVPDENVQEAMCATKIATPPSSTSRSVSFPIVAPKQHTWAPMTPLTWSDVVADESLRQDLDEIQDLDSDDDDDVASEKYRLLHRVACERGYRQYVDPGSGYTVFTSVYLKERACCGYKCRHCPWGHKNVPKGVNDSKPNLDW
ncbi:cobyrinic acid a,c-diamide synthase [Aphanomyces invadans]|uniref:Cobyrinic acid a,c-diamide synthase n=1 Tax=Aphanomyces invadans TaxID=157072 RepID=A0A024UQT2_9STRA|nr:cobyrinic acid a,c-diamide synthase [Aphanomyces invadans]ETW08811.1 cobyrinic acid a,c-diamide synthase [Aphanomyces invadans]|eukprot:XP_008862616.1 cobyrinic acid a,c-diamide synthase [Aphanomyces invadans]